MFQRVMPGNRQEMLEYEEAAQKCTRVKVELNLPSVNVCLPNKPFLERVYNRCVNPQRVYNRCVNIQRVYNRCVTLQQIQILVCVYHD